MGEWQPIETAPKDGTTVLLLILGVVIEGSWGRNACLFWDVAWLPSHGCGCCTHPNPEPTHWMPLPPPPGADQ